MRSPVCVEKTDDGKSKLVHVSHRMKEGKRYFVRRDGHYLALERRVIMWSSTTAGPTKYARPPLRLSESTSKAGVGGALSFRIQACI